jgi:hypothetical protein
VWSSTAAKNAASITNPAPALPLHQVAKPLVRRKMSEGAGERVKRRETHCNTVVGTGALPLWSLVKYRFETVRPGAAFVLASTPLRIMGIPLCTGWRASWATYPSAERCLRARLED